MLLLGWPVLLSVSPFRKQKSVLVLNRWRNAGAFLSQIDLDSWPCKRCEAACQVFFLASGAAQKQRYGTGFTHFVEFANQLSVSPGQGDGKKKATSGQHIGAGAR